MSGIFFNPSNSPLNHPTSSSKRKTQLESLIESLPKTLQTFSSTSYQNNPSAIHLRSRIVLRATAAESQENKISDFIQKHRSKLVNNVSIDLGGILNMPL